MNHAWVLLQQNLGHSFTNLGLLRAAITHRSVKKDHNERLEFLGDSVLGFIVTDHLFSAHPDANEGLLSHIRSVLVKRSTLAEIARELNLGEYLHLGMSERKSGGFNRESILADALEAVIGAIFLDAGLAKVRECVMVWYQARLNHPDLLQTQKDAKTQLQEYCQSRKLALPQYTLLASEGAAHALSFSVSCAVPGFDWIEQCTAKTRRAAEQQAAAALLQRFQDV
jgi:ribonuclease-3